MKKRLISILVLACMVCSFMCACGAKEEITAEQAVSIVMDDLGAGVMIAGDPHVHAGTYKNKDCFNIYITVDGESWIYVISNYGEILVKGLGNHSH